jgi:hypothetical protein
MEFQGRWDTPGREGKKPAWQRERSTGERLQDCLIEPGAGLAPQSSPHLTVALPLASALVSTWMWTAWEDTGLWFCCPTAEVILGERWP